MSENKSSSVEMACRELRYRWFDEELSAKGAGRIVTGHNADDNVETLFLNLLRGSGTRGLRGMNTDNGKIWRPLLSFHRCSILEFINKNNLEYIIDSSNLKNDFRRNFLRNQIIPLLKSEWKGFDKAIDSSINYITEENKIVDSSTSFAADLAEKKQPLKRETILKFPSPSSLIRRYIEPAGPFPTTAQEILNAIKADKPHTRYWKVKSAVILLKGGYLSIVSGHCKSGS